MIPKYITYLRKIGSEVKEDFANKGKVLGIKDTHKLLSFIEVLLNEIPEETAIKVAISLDNISEWK